MLYADAPCVPVVQERWEEPDMEYHVRGTAAATGVPKSGAQSGEEDLEIDAQVASEHKVGCPCCGTASSCSGTKAWPMSLCMQGCICISLHAGQ